MCSTLGTLLRTEPRAQVRAVFNHESQVDQLLQIFRFPAVNCFSKLDWRIDQDASSALGGSPDGIRAEPKAVTCWHVTEGPGGGNRHVVSMNKAQLKALLSGQSEKFLMCF